MWTYTVLLHQEVGYLKSTTRQRLANHELWNFFKLVGKTLKHPTKHPRPPHHRPPLTPPLSHSLTLLLQLHNIFSASLINWSWNQAVCFISPAVAQDDRWRLFLRKVQQTVELWAARQKYKVTQITPGYKLSAFKKGCTSCWKMWPVLIFCGWKGVLAFHLCGW